MEKQTTIYSATVSKLDHWPRTTSQDGAARNSVRNRKYHGTGSCPRTTQQREEEKAKRASRGYVDVMESDRRLTDRDISVVASQLGNSWRVLGQRLNFTPETLDAIAESTSALSTENTGEQMAESMLRYWSTLPTATVGRLVVVLWEMGHHVTAMLLQP